MDFNTYQIKAHTTSQNTKIGNDETLYPVFGLCGESGEVAEKFKKLYRDKSGVIDEEFVLVIKKELGDILWYVAQACLALNISLEELTDMNIKKLSKRYPEGMFDAYYSENRAADDR
jgi:NTP pyrophosphatase (non-canonical NTP hydrolase)